jgi:hypothetical protein
MPGTRQLGAAAIADALGDSTCRQTPASFRAVRANSGTTSRARPLTPSRHTTTYEFRSLLRSARITAYPFGYGLSYTTLSTATQVEREISPMRADRFSLVTNTGKRAGVEIAQCDV